MKDYYTKKTRQGFYNELDFGIFLYLRKEIENKKERNNMKCALCGKEIKGRDHIRVNAPYQKDIYVHSMPCEWYVSEGNTDNAA